MAKKKKDPKVKVPNAWSSKKSKEGGGSKTGLSGSGGKVMTDAIWSVGLVVVGILLLLFIFLGGVNQRKVVNWVVSFSQNIGRTVSGWFNPENIEISDDGVYYRVNGTTKSTEKDKSDKSEPTNESGESSETSETSETSEVKETVKKKKK